MDAAQKQFWLIVAGIVISALVLRALISRGKGWVEGLIGIAAGAASAAIFAGVAHLGDGAPQMFGLSAVFSTPEAWTGACAAFGALFGDRLATGVSVEVNRFKKDPSAWIDRVKAWRGKGGGGG